MYKDKRIVLSSVECTLLQKRPQSDHDLLLSAMGPYANMVSVYCQTGDNFLGQDTQTSSIKVWSVCATHLYPVLMSRSIHHASIRNISDLCDSSWIPLCAVRLAIFVTHTLHKVLDVAQLNWSRTWRPLRFTNLYSAYRQSMLKVRRLKI